MTKNKEEIKREVEEFFKDTISKSKNQVKKIKTRAMSINLKLGERKKLYCKKCYQVYDSKDRVRIRDGKKIIICSYCNKNNNWKIK